MAEHKNSVYRQISEDIAKKIKDGKYASGSLLAPERKLMLEYNTQRTTIRRALEILVKEGLIVKKTGLGTFIADPENSVPVSEKEVVSVKKQEKTVLKSNRKSLPSCVSFEKNYAEAVSEIFEKLFSLGHKRVIYIGRADDIYSAFCGEAVKEGIYDSDLVARAEGRYDADIMFERVWRSYRSSKPTCVMADTVEDAEKIMKIAERMGISVPGELSVACVETNKASAICGGLFDSSSLKKQLLQAFEGASDKDIPKMQVKVAPVFFEGETLAEVKADRIGSGRMSDYLL